MNSTTALPYITMMSTRPVTVVETAEFQRQASTVFSAEEVKDLITHLAYHPTAGSVMCGALAAFASFAGPRVVEASVAVPE